MFINIQDDILRLRAMGLLERLLQDKTTKGNILWATDAYAYLGDGYNPGEEIRSDRIAGENFDIIKNRARRAMEQRTERKRQHGEVVTPLWVVKKMNDFADEEWFGRKTGIYKLTDEGKIYFSKGKHWRLYVDARRLEITCGEAPFLVTRYDAETGEALPIEERVGLLDRKLRAVSENAESLDEWKEWALRAVQATYGYELQGDNLLIARVNILCTVEEHMFHRWRERAEKDWLSKLCNVISWNLWQMDGIKGCVPVPPTPTEEQLSLFEPIQTYSETNLFGEKEEKDIPCVLHDWRAWRTRSYKTLREKGPELMKFDFIIGNPPYQIEQNGRMLPIYNAFMDEAFMLSDVVELITPGRFLFNAGQTSSEWNKKMLSDPHFTVLSYEPDSKKVFSGVDIKGGVAISLHNNRVCYGAIEVFIPYDELRTALRKVKEQPGFKPLSGIIYTNSKYALDTMYADHPEYKQYIKSDGRHSQIDSVAFAKVPIFLREKPANDEEAYVRFLGRYENQRAYRWVRRKYIVDMGNIDYYKVLVSSSTGSGKLGETLSTPIIGGPQLGYTQSFLGIGAFIEEFEADACMKYVKTKFCRALWATLKITQHNPPSTWANIPCQDFTPTSDIDWSKSIAEIDQQLYRKYGLDEAEIEFIETHVKEMSLK